MQPEVPMILDDKSLLSIKQALFYLEPETLSTRNTVTLVGGTKTVTNAKVRPTSIILISVKSIGGIIGFLRCSAGDGTFTIQSSSGADTSTVYYFIIY